MSEEQLLGLAEAALAAGGADGIEVLLSRSDSALTRFADSRIHQNTARVDGEARVRVVVDGSRVGVVSTNELTASAVRDAVGRAVEIARLVPPDPEFGGLAEPASYAPAGVDDPATAAASPADRAGWVRALLAPLPPGVLGAGAVETARLELAIANTNGVRGYHAGSRAAASILASGEDSTGHAESAGSTVDSLDLAALGERAGRKVELGRHPRELAPGTYSVVLEPGATVALAQWLAFIAFPGKAVAEGRSPLSGRMGQQVCSPQVTIVDDALSPLVPGVPFDAEGTPKRRLPLIERGVAVGLAYDRTTAAAAGTTSTGHALPAPNPYGGLPLHVIMEPGDGTLDELVAGCPRGLYITRFHYTNLVHPVESTITGMTRDGTFLIEDGRIVGGVRNLRFTQSILGALSGVEAVGRETELVSEPFFGGARTPGVRLSGFAFTSTTSF